MDLAGISSRDAKHLLRRAGGNTLRERRCDLARSLRASSWCDGRGADFRPDSRCGNARRGFRAASRPMRRPAALTSPCCAARYCRCRARSPQSAHRFRQAVTFPDHADMRRHHRAQSCSRRARACAQIARNDQRGREARGRSDLAARDVLRDACGIDHGLEQRVRREPIGAMRAGATTLRRRPIIPAARCGRARRRRCRPCDNARPARPGSAAWPDRCRRRMQLAWTVGNLSAKRAPSASRASRNAPWPAAISANTPRATMSRGASSASGWRASMKRSPLSLIRRRAFAAQRFGGERRGIAADHDRGRMELHEFGIGDHGAGARGDRKPEAAGLGRVGRHGIEMTDAAGREHHRAGGDDHGPCGDVADLAQLQPGDRAVLGRAALRRQNLRSGGSTASCAPPRSAPR